MAGYPVAVRLAVAIVSLLLVAAPVEARPKRGRVSAAGKREVAALLRQAELQKKSGKAADAYRTYESLLARFTRGLSKKQRKQAAQALATLGSWTALLRFGQAAGATVTLDGATVDASRPLRVDPGRHTVQATRAGADPFAAVVQLAPGQDETLELKLVAEAHGGQLLVRERTGADLVVVVDGREMGPAPWEGEVEPGRHSIEARGARHEASAASVDVQRRGRVEVELAAVQVREHVKLGCTVEGAKLAIDGQLQALPFEGALPLGRHALALSAPGHRTLERPLEVTAGRPIDEQLAPERVAAAAAAPPPPPPVEPERRTRFGLFAGGTFPSGVLVEASLRIRDAVALGARWTYQPDYTLADIRFHTTSYQGTLRWYPWRGAFHLGVGGGVQQYTSSSGSATVRARVDTFQPIVTPHLGWHWLAGRFLFGFEVGARLVLGDAKAKLTDTSGQPLAEAAFDDDARGIRTDAQDLASRLAILPTLGLDLGFYF